MRLFIISFAFCCLPLDADLLTGASPTTLNSADLHIFAEFILWTAANAEVANNKQFTPGFKLGGGILLNHDITTLDAEWEHFSYTGHEPLWTMHCNQIMVTLGRSSFIGKNTTIKPYFGLIDTFIKQSSAIGSTTVKNNGVGICLGLESAYYFFYDRYGMGLLGKGTASGLWGKQTSCSYVPEVSSLVQDTLHTVMPFVDLSIGIDCWFPSASRKYQCSIFTGWEGQVWFFPHDTPFHSLSTLSATGLTIRGRFDF